VIAPNPTKIPTCTSTPLRERLFKHFLLHHLSLCNNLYKHPPYLKMCGHRNPMSLLRLRSQSHQSISTHPCRTRLDRTPYKSPLRHLPARLDYPDHSSTNLPYGRRPLIYPPQETPPRLVASEVNPLWHPWLCLPLRKSFILDLSPHKSPRLYDTCQPDWTALTPHQQISLNLGDPPSTLSKKHYHVWLRSNPWLCLPPRKSLI